MEAIQQARKLFLKCHIHQASLKDSDKQQLGRDIQRFINIAIKEATSKDLFENPLMLDVLKSALKQRAKENPDVMPVARAFQSLEKYFILLVEQPWKLEFKEIKMYGGFYKTRIKSVLPDCESVFEHAGYMVLPDSCTMVHRGQINKNFLLLLAFDCRVGQVECETIAEHYNKVKGLSMSLEDAVSNILHDEYSRDKIALKYGYHQGNGLIVNMPVNSNITVPPALPKREPIGNSSNIRHNVTYESESAIYNNPTANMFDSKTGIAFPPKSPSRTSDLYSSVLAQSSITPSGVNPDKFTYLDVSSKEILPDLPQGTSEDHMIESLRHLNMKEISRLPAPDSWKRYDGYVNDRIETRPFSVNGLKSGVVLAQNSFKPTPSIDEGIEQDLSTSRVYPHSTKYTSVGGHPAVPNKHLVNHQQVSFDPGYRTVTPESMYSPSTASFLQNIGQQTIYHPPNVATDCVGPGGHSNTFVTKHGAPPPIPSRALKPKSVKDEDALLQSKLYASVPQYFSQPARSCEVMPSRSPLSAPGYSTVARSYNVEPVLRRERLMLGKTNSLKTGDATSAPLPQPAATGRTVRSMDMTLTSWECQSCGTLNAALHVICFACSYSRLGSEVSSPTSGEPKLSCTSCTFANSPDKTHCDMCGSKLREKFTLV